MALKDFASAIDAETSEIMVVGSSLKGLLQMDKYKEIADKLKFKIGGSAVRVKFLLTHPVVADLRAGQEARKPTDIGREIIDSLRILKDWNVPPHPYGAVAYDSPCLIIETSSDRPSYFYDAFDASHFGAWDTNVAERIYDYEEAIHRLESKIDKYADMASQMLQL